MASQVVRVLLQRLESFQLPFHSRWAAFFYQPLLLSMPAHDLSNLSNRYNAAPEDQAVDPCFHSAFQPVPLRLAGLGFDCSTFPLDTFRSDPAFSPQSLP